ncbi:MAG: cellulase family glycosylhydrolase [Patescibacteria group bacterium]
MKKRFLVGLLLGFSVFMGALVSRAPIVSSNVWGITFAPQYMEEFGIPWKEAYNAMLSELDVRHIRIPIYWSRVEPKEGQFVFDDYDYQLQKAEEVGARVVLGVGRKLPRWPECHEATWATDLEVEKKKKLILKYIEQVVNRYKDSQVLDAWQVENEPFLPFGGCSLYDAKFLDEEIALVRSLDSRHPVLVTDSGELSIWVSAARRGDIFGTTMYRTIYSKYVGSFTYPLFPSFFRFKRALTELVVGKKPMIVIELQAEPWAPGYIPHMTKEDQYKYFSPTTFQGIIQYAKRTGFDTYYLWGAEWWYWLKVHENDPEIWNIAKALFKQ